MAPGSAADRRRCKHIAYAREHLKGKVSSVIVTRPNTTIDRIETAKAGSNWSVTYFNPITGAFRLKRI